MPKNYFICFFLVLFVGLVIFPEMARADSIAPVELKTLPDTIGLEYSDRIKRLSRLAALQGISQPKISSVQLEAGKIPGVDFPVPVVRVLFDEGVFFDTNKDTLHSNGKKVINLLAESIKHDVPDVKLLVVGHTDSVGSVEYNMDLSRRRAVNIMKMLNAAGVDLDAMIAVPIGMAQPIASNATDEGRAKNRRVEFMLSAFEKANLQLVQLRRVVSDYLPADLAAQNISLTVPQAVDVVSLSPASGGDLEVKKTEQIELQKPAPLSEINLNKPADYKKNELNDEFVLE